MGTLAKNVKKFAGATVMAAAVTAVGFGLATGTAQAKPTHPHPHPGTSTQNGPNPQSRLNPQNGLHNFIQSTDTGIADPFQALFGLGEGTPFDDFTDSFHGLM